MMEKRYELLIIYLMCLCNRFLLEIHYLGKFTGKFILCQKNVAKSKMCGVSVLFCLGGGDDCITSHCSQVTDTVH